MVSPSIVLPETPSVVQLNHVERHKRGHKYLTLVYQIDEGAKRLLWIGQDRTAKTLLRFFRMLGKERSGQLKFVCSDMWRAYLKVIAKKAAGAVHVLDRFHIMQKMNKAIDEVRAAEAKRLKADGYEPVLKHSRWCLLKRRENLTEKRGRQVIRTAQVQLAVGSQSFAARGLSAILGICQPRLGGPLPRPVVHPHDAIEDRAHEESRPNLAQSSRTDSQLVPGEGGHFGRDDRGF